MHRQSKHQTTHRVPIVLTMLIERSALLKWSAHQSGANISVDELRRQSEEFDYSSDRSILTEEHCLSIESGYSGSSPCLWRRPVFRRCSTVTGHKTRGLMSPGRLWVRGYHAASPHGTASQSR